MSIVPQYLIPVITFQIMVTLSRPDHSLFGHQRCHYHTIRCLASRVSNFILRKSDPRETQVHTIQVCTPISSIYKAFFLSWVWVSVFMPFHGSATLSFPRFSDRLCVVKRQMSSYRAKPLPVSLFFYMLLQIQLQNHMTFNVHDTCKRPATLARCCGPTHGTHKCSCNLIATVTSDTAKQSRHLFSEILGIQREKLQLQLQSQISSDKFVM